MQLTPEQEAVLKTFIQTDPSTSGIGLGDDGPERIADILNAPAAPDFWVSRTDLGEREFFDATSPDGTVFIWAGNGYITRSAGERDCLRAIFAAGYADCSKAGIKQAFTDIFSGTGNAANNLTHAKAMGRRLASVFEKLLATGTGSTASPAIMAVEGPVSANLILSLYD